MTYLIIGASSGLGRALANKFAKEKKNLIIASRDDRDLIAIKSDLEIKYNVNVEKIALDFSSFEELNQKLATMLRLEDAGVELLDMEDGGDDEEEDKGKDKKKKSKKDGDNKKGKKEEDDGGGSGGDDEEGEDKEDDKADD